MLDPVSDGVVTEEETSWLLAIDPGEEHIGIARFVRYPDRFWELVESEHIEGRERAEDYISSDLTCGRYYARVVIEEYRIYPGQNVWSECQTAWMIGVVLFAARRALVPVTRQKAVIKTPTRAILQAKGFQSMAPSGHAKDAELHGWHWIMRNDPGAFPSSFEGGSVGGEAI